MSDYDGRDGQMFVLVAAVIIAVLVLPAVYAMYAGKVNGPLLAYARFELWPQSLFSDDAALIRQKLAQVDPAQLDWNQIWKILAYSGSWLRWPCLILLIFFVLLSLTWGNVEKLSRKFNMEKLLANNARHFPCLKPVVGRGKYLLSPESYDKGLWRIARTPAQFAFQNSILAAPNGSAFCMTDAFLNGLPSMEKPAFGKCKFDADIALSVLKKQLGSPFKGFDDLAPARKTIACAFMLYAIGQKDNCMALLDSASQSYTERDAHADCSVFSDSEFLAKLTAMKADFEKFCQRSSIERHMAFQLPLFMAILGEARKKGVLACSQFLWLRPVDRPLWYALSQCGGRVAWAEGLAAWSHYLAEEQEGSLLHEPHLDAGVASLRKSLEAQGWFLDIYIPKSGGDVDKDGNVSAPAEDNDED